MTSECHIIPWVQTPLLSYLTHPTHAEITGNWISFREIPGGIEWQGLFRSRCEEPLRRLADDNPDLLNDLLILFCRQNNRLVRGGYRPSAPSPAQGAGTHLLPGPGGRSAIKADHPFRCLLPRQSARQIRLHPLLGTGADVCQDCRAPPVRAAPSGIRVGPCRKPPRTISQKDQVFQNCFFTSWPMDFPAATQRSGEMANKMA